MSWQKTSSASSSHAEAVKLSHAAYMEALREAEAKRGVFMGNVGEMRAAGATNREIGDVLGVSRQRVSQLLKGRGEDA